MTLTLWDFITPRRIRNPRSRRPVRPSARAAPARPTPKHESPAQAKYRTMQRDMLERYGVRVRKWRSNSSGVAWQITYADGSISKLIESPRPTGPVSAAIFLHEIGHHAIGFGVYSPRCLEELEAWCFSLDQMEAWDVAITDRVRKRVHESLVYAVDKARRRGLKRVPAALIPYARSGSDGVDGWVDPRASDARGPS